LPVDGQAPGGVVLDDAANLGRSRDPAPPARAWDAGARPATITLNIDATLLTAHSDKELAAGNYQAWVWVSSVGVLAS
jgi:hypothetical protein